MTTPTRRNVVRLGAVTLLAVSVAAYAQQPQIAKESGLPYLAGADVWVDQSGKPPALVPGIQPGQLEKMRVLVFRPSHVLKAQINGEEVALPDAAE